MIMPLEDEFNTDQMNLKSCVVDLIALNTWGVFARSNMSKGTIVEQSIVRIVNDQYWFLWEQEQYVFGSGQSQLYNHSDSPNIAVIRDYINNKMYFYAINEIKAEQELLHCYPDWGRYELTSSGEAEKAQKKLNNLLDPRIKIPSYPLVSNKIKVKPSKIDRLGVFAKESINSGELIETALVLPVNGHSWFRWGNGENIFCSGIAHFFRSGQANTEVVPDYEYGLLRFILSQDISEGEELIISVNTRN